MFNQVSHEEHLHSLALVMTDALKAMLWEKAEQEFSSEPIFELQDIVQFNGRMRVDAMEKFNAPTVFSVITFYATKKDMKNEKNALGAMIVYLEQYFVDKMLHIMDYPTLDDEDDEEELKDSCGTIANMIAGYFVAKIQELGFAHLEMSHFKSYVNTAVSGVEFPDNQVIKYEISYFLKRKKRIMIDIAMGAIPRAGEKKKTMFN